MTLPGEAENSPILPTNDRYLEPTGAKMATKPFCSVSTPHGESASVAPHAGLSPLEHIPSLSQPTPYPGTDLPDKDSPLSPGSSMDRAMGEIVFSQGSLYASPELPDMPPQPL